MNNSKLLGFLAVMFFTLSIFSSCTKDDIDETKTTETETPTFDCPSLELNIGDTCVNASGNFNLVDANCDCLDYTTYDCPSLELNIGDTCVTSAGNLSIVDSNCDCPENNSFDCPSLNANIGDACVTSAGNSGTINANCDCEETTSSVDCPGWGLNIGDACMYYDAIFDSTTMTIDTILINGALDLNCDCL